MLNLKTTIVNGLEKGYFEDISSTQNTERKLSIKKKISTYLYNIWDS